MTVAFSSVTNPAYANTRNTAIDCMVTLTDDSDHQYAGQSHPFTATANDSMPYGAALWAAFVAGTYGEIAAYVAPTLTPQQNVAAALAAGIVITSTGTPSLNGTYPISTAAQNQLNGVMTYILVNGNFPGGAASLPWYDTSGAAHHFSSVAAFKEFATAFADFVAAVSIYANSNGESGPIPSNAITIS